MELSPTHVRIFFGGKYNILHFSLLTSCRFKNSTPIIKGRGISSLSHIKGFEARNFLLMPLKALGIIFSNNVDINVLLKRFNYEPSLINMFMNYLATAVRSKIRGSNNLFPPYEVDQDLTEQIMQQCGIEDKAQEIYLYYLQFNECYKYVLYTIAYLFFADRTYYLGITDSVVYQHLIRFFPEKFAYYDIDEIKNIIYELSQHKFLNRKTHTIYTQDGSIRGNQYMIEILGGAEKINAELIALSQDKNVIKPNLNSWNRKRILKPIKLLKLAHNPEYYTISVGPSLEMSMTYDYATFKKRYKQFEKLPSSFSLMMEHFYSQFDESINTLLECPGNGGMRTSLSFMQFCLLRQYTVVNVSFDPDFWKSDKGGTGLAIKIDNFVEQLSNSSNSPIVVFMNFNMDYEQNSKILIDFVNHNIVTKDDSVLLKKIVIILSPDSFVNVMMDKTNYFVKLNHILPTKWTKTSISHALLEYDLPLEFTDQILSESHGFDELVMHGIYKHLGKNFTTKFQTSKPILKGQYANHLRIVKQLCDKYGKIYILDFESLMISNSELSDCFNGNEDELSKFFQIIYLFGVCSLEYDYMKEMYYYELDSHVASGKIFPIA
jgi:hypothetical protein